MKNRFLVLSALLPVSLCMGSTISAAPATEFGRATQSLPLNQQARRVLGESGYANLMQAFQAARQTNKRNSTLPVKSRYLLRSRLMGLGETRLSIGSTAAPGDSLDDLQSSSGSILQAPDAAAQDAFGASVTVSGDTAVVGSPYDDTGSFKDQGSVYVFTRSAGLWSLQAKLLAADGSQADYFGSSVCLDGNTALIGALADDLGTAWSYGSAYVFTRNANVWKQQAKLVAAGGKIGNKFGISVALSGDTAIVGALQDGMVVDTGKAYVFTRSGTAWSQEATLAAADGLAGDGFGVSVAATGDVIAVGAAWKSVGANGNQGAAYVFTRSGTTWTQATRLIAPNGASGDHFGRSVSASEGAVLVGAPDQDISGRIDQGAAYVFLQSGSGWILETQLTAGDGAAGDKFGNAVALSGETAVVGAVYDDPPQDQGSAYLFTRRGVWGQRAHLLPENGHASDYFGLSVAVTGDTAIAGAPIVNENQGAAYVFELTPWAPEQLFAGAVSPRQIDLSWIDCSGIESGFEIQRSSGAVWSVLRHVGANSNVLTDANVLPSQHYYYRVRALYPDGGSPWSSVAEAITPDEGHPPASPTGLYATALSGTELKVAWSDNSSDETGFQLQRSQNRTTWTWSKDLAPNVVDYTDTGLTAAKTYYYRIRAFNSSGYSAWGEPATGVTLPNPPSAPTNLRIVLPSTNSLVLLWSDRSSNEQGFRIERRVGTTGDFSTLMPIGADHTSHLDNGLSPNTVYSYRIRAYNAGGNSAYSNVATGSTVPPPPVGPSGLTATALSNRVVSVAWNDLPTETEYRLERKTGTTAFAQIAIITQNGTGYFDSAVAPSTTYTYRLRAANTGGVGPYSANATATTQANATQGELDVRPGRVTFPVTTPKHTRLQKIVARNKGKGPLTVVLSALAAPFVVEAPKQFRLRPNEKRVLKVRYTAPADGFGATATLTLGNSGRRNPIVVVPVSAECTSTASD